ncbi:hypothetical protein MAPG_05440 [Magnaporthiopsis poae ATCC 64411]|uniref:Mid2 domain-containing protein n=1 Tax=Magnaporthiopsis poae (strain ATCC 64411 / 73-15) TaxID=644358 RepID=A0A0C4DZE2_MAGP6|nr:hypothetical protein MAPG_05440 [Magnaporthiopsis poae ATCC 64411]
MRPHGAVETAVWLLWLACAGADEQQRFAAMEAAPALEARWYPPLVVDAVPANPLVRRQDVLSCPPGYHNCLDVGSGGSCCQNGSYCIINRKGVLQCCGAGSTCSSDTDCDPSKYQCNSTRAVTTTASGGSTSVRTETIGACCGRQCRTSSFRCPTQMGGGCCSYGETCASNSACLKARSQTATGFVPQAPEGCTTSQISCPSSIGGGCCPVGRSCTQVGSSVACATVPVAPPDGVTSVGQGGGDGGMSTGAKAGIAVGVVLGSAIIIGVATWLCIRKRRGGTVSYQQSFSQIQGGGGLDSGRSVSGKSDVTSPSRVSNLDARAFSTYSQTPAVPDGVHSRFELHGSDMPEIGGREVPRGEEQHR